MKTNLFKGLGLTLIAAMLVALMALAFPAGAVYAAAPTPGAQPNKQKKDKKYPQLVQAFRRETNNAKLQELTFNKVDGLAQSADEFIAKRKAEGKDTSALETVLAQFRADLAIARATNDQAVALLNTHAGFDDQGQVTDAQQAEATLKSVHDGLKASREQARAAVEDLRAAWKAFREANPKSSPTPEPASGG